MRSSPPGSSPAASRPTRSRSSRRRPSRARISPAEYGQSLPNPGRRQEVSKRHHEQHRIERTGWLRAAVLGANDGIVSTSSLILGVAAAQGFENSVIVAGVAGVVAGAMSMATGEYVSVHSQA